MDLNIDNYTNDELIEILELNDPSNENIIMKTDFYIDKFKNEGKNEYASFFLNLQKRLLIEYVTSDSDSSDDENIKREFKTNNDLVNDNRNLTERQETNIKENINIPFKKGILNPNLKNIITKIINVDSQFRQNSIENNFLLNTTNFTIDLTHPLTNVLNMKLYSIQIPFTWYNIDSAYGTDYIEYNGTKYTINSGYYNDWSSVQSKLNAIQSLDLNFEQDPNTYKIKITSTSGGTIHFYNKNILGNSGKINHNLGWILGFRKQSYTIIAGQFIISEAVPDLYGAKYLFLEVDDFNQNHLNNTIVNSTDNHDVKLKRPSYFNRDLSYVIQDDGLFQLQPDDKRTITQNQLYAFNAINTNLFNNQSFEKTSAPPTTDYLGLIPLKHSGFVFGDVFIENGGGMPINERSYFGPVNISRLAIRLLDDKGNVLNLNGCDWSFSFTCDTLYQY